MPSIQDQRPTQRGVSVSFMAAVVTTVISCVLLWWLNVSWQADSRISLEVLEQMRLAGVETMRGYLLTERAMAGEDTLGSGGQCDYFRQASQRAQEALDAMRTLDGHDAMKESHQRIVDRLEHYRRTIASLDALVCATVSGGIPAVENDLVRKTMADVERIQSGLTLDIHSRFKEMISLRESVGSAVVLAWAAFMSMVLALAALAGHRRRQAEDLLFLSEDRFRLLVESSRDAIFIQLGGRFSYANPACLALFGAGVESELLGTPVLDRIHPGDRGAVAQRIRDLNERRQEAPPREQSMLRLDGTVFMAEVAAHPIVAEGENGALVYARDITESKRHQEAILNSLHEKEVLLKEVHHRVKNNLQVVSSLIYLQSQAAGDPAEQERYRLLQGRIISMALIHQQLYRSVNLGAIDMGSYLEELISRIAALYDPGNTVAVDLTAGGVSVPLDKAVPCGLLVNELVTNAYKHAFPGGAGGTIHVGMRVANGEALLSVWDGGPGEPALFDSEEGETLGIRLVRELTRQLKGQITASRNGGLLVEVRFTLASTGAASQGNGRGNGRT